MWATDQGGESKSMIDARTTRNGKEEANAKGRGGDDDEGELDREDNETKPNPWSGGMGNRQDLNLKEETKSMAQMQKSNF